MNQQISRELSAEFIGTFMLVFVGAGAVILNPAATGALIPALAHGLILVAIIATFGHISGAHVNPAVSLAAWLGGHLSTQKLGYYMLVQFLGAFVACGALLAVMPTPGQLGQTVPAVDVNELGIVVIEGLLTFFLVSAVYQTDIYGKGGSATPIILGLTLGGCIVFGGALTGAALNPARMLAPALLGKNMQSLTEIIVYLVAIFGGGALAGLIHMDTFKPEDPDGAKKARRK